MVSQVPKEALESVYVKSNASHLKKENEVHGWDFNKGIDYESMFRQYTHVGFQASALGKAIEEVNKMIKWRLSDEEPTEKDVGEFLDPEFRKNVRCTIMLGYTSNMSSCGVRDIIRYLC